MWDGGGGPQNLVRSFGNIEKPRKRIIKKLLVNVGLKIDKNSD